jgi:hypothetical protein
MATLVQIRGLDRAENSSGSPMSKRGFRIRTAASGTKASFTTALTGANNDVVFTAKWGGTYGNDITITYSDPGGTTATLGVVVSGHAITVNLGRASSAINTTGANIVSLINGDANASKLVTVANAAANDGTGLVTAMATQTLVGGVTASGSGIMATTADEAAAQSYDTVEAGKTVTVDLDDQAVARVLRRNHFRFVTLPNVVP